MKKVLLSGFCLALGTAAALAVPQFRSANPDPLHGALGARPASGWNTVTAAAPARIAPEHSMVTDELVFLDGPDGSTWFATTSLDITEVPLPGGYATNKIINGYTYTIYNDAFEEIGTIHDQVRLGEGETKAAQIMLGATVTKKFFNSDNKTEVTVTLVMNKEDNYSYPAVNIRTLVYSVGGEKSDGTNDDVLMTIPGYPVAAVNTATDAWSESFYISFLSESAGNPDDYESHIDYLGSIKSTVTTYSKATWGGSISEFDVYELCHFNIPGDGMNNPYYILCIKDGKLTVITSKYEKSFFVDPSGMGGNEDLTPDNHLIVNVRQLPAGWGASTLEDVASLTIPTTQKDNEDILCTFYSVGSLMYDRDVDFGHYTTDGSAAFVVTTADCKNADDDDYIESYYVYNAAGNRIMTLAENTENFLMLNDIAGLEPQAMFIYNQGTAYTYDFVDLYSGTTALTIPHIIDNKVISTSLERVNTPKGVLYASSLNTAADDAQGNTWHEVGWINQEGVFDHIDRINLGKNVAIAQVYIAPNALNPYLFNTDSTQEYMFLVKRLLASGSSQTREELLIIAPESEPIMTVLPDETKGVLANVGLVWTATPRLMVGYMNENDVYSADFYDLPLTRFAGGDGTAENPYLIATVGDLQQIKFNTSAHYRVVADINATGFDFVSIPDFSGSLDGNGKTVANLTVNGNGIFKSTNAGAVIKDITLVDATVALSGSSFTYSGLLVGMAQTTAISNVRVLGLKVSSADFDDSFGSLVGRMTLNSSITGCNVAGAVINLPEGSAGGIVGNVMTGSTVTACAFTGSITAASEVGGIAATIYTDGTIADCHVNADLTAVHTIGGIVATSGRAPVVRNHVEGTITATGANRWKGHCVGGVIGTLQGDYQDSGVVSVSANFVGLEAINVDAVALGTPNYPGALDSAHRIIGWSMANDEPEIVDYDEFDEPIYSTDPVSPDPGLADNYVISSLEPLSADIADAATTTEGCSKSRWELEQDFMEGLGFKFGQDNDNPWNIQSINTPKLYFETGAILAQANITTHVGDNFNIVVRLLDRRQLTLDDVLGNFSMEYDEAKVEMTGNASVENNILTIEMKAIAEGTSSYSLRVLGSTVQGTIEATVSGIADTEIAAEAIAIRYNGTTVSAEGCAIELYNVAGTKVAAGNDAVETTSLPAGVYIVRAAAAGASRTAKIAVR